jgi:hypothetical protein
MGALHGELRPLSISNDVSRLDQEGFACHRELHAVRHAVKQRSSKLLFQISDLLADRRLTDSKLLGRPREIPLLCHRHEITDMTQFYWHLQIGIAATSSLTKGNPKFIAAEKSALRHAPVSASLHQDGSESGSIAYE